MSQSITIVPTLMSSSEGRCGVDFPDPRPTGLNFPSADAAGLGGVCAGSRFAGLSVSIDVLGDVADARQIPKILSTAASSP